MNNQLVKNDSKKLPIWYKILTIILVIVLVFLVFGFVAELKDDMKKYYSDPSNFGYRVAYRHYSDLYEDTQDLVNDNKYNPSSYAQYTALGEYYNSAIVYYALVDTDPTEAARFKAIMDESYGNVGELAGEVEKIDNLLTFKK